MSNIMFNIIMIYDSQTSRVGQLANCVCPGNFWGLTYFHNPFAIYKLISLYLL